jgi:hypothetical protein
MSNKGNTRTVQLTPVMTLQIGAPKNKTCYPTAKYSSVTKMCQTIQRVGVDIHPYLEVKWTESKQNKVHSLP